MPTRKKKVYTTEEKQEIVDRLRAGKERARIARDALKTPEALEAEQVKRLEKLNKTPRKKVEPPPKVDIPQINKEAPPLPPPPPPPPEIPQQPQQSIKIEEPPPPKIEYEDSTDEEDGDYIPLPSAKPLPPPPQPPKPPTKNRVVIQPDYPSEPTFQQPRRRPQLPPNILEARKQAQLKQQNKQTQLDLVYSSLF
jgi:hypothetical protein